MKSWFPRLRSGLSSLPQSMRVLAVQLLVLILVAVGVLAASTQPATADAGPWPTPTRPVPTPLPVLLPTLTSTPPFVPLPTFIPTNTPIPLAPEPVFPIATVAIPTPLPAPSGISALLCWPFAIAFILIAILVSSVFLNRRGP